MTAVGASAFQIDIGLVGKSLTDILMEKSAVAPMSHLDAWTKRPSLLSEDDIMLKKRGCTADSSIEDSLGDIVVEVQVGSEMNKVPMLVDTGGPNSSVKDSFYPSSKSSSASNLGGIFMVG